MKKIVAMLLLVVMMASLTAAHAEDLGVQIIGGPGSDTTPMSLDDLQLGQEYTLDGYAIIKPLEGTFMDWFAQFNKDADPYKTGREYVPRTRPDAVYYYFNSSNDGFYYTDAAFMDSGLTADFFLLRIDITNLQKKAVPFMKDAEIKVVYNDNYEFGGWVRQVNLNYNNLGTVTRYSNETTGLGFVVQNPANEEPISTMYTGIFYFGCTLPMAVVNDTKAPLKMIITLGGNELTYYVHK